jgi:Ca2+-binding EF-hand superfamily protein
MGMNFSSAIIGALGLVLVVFTEPAGAFDESSKRAVPAKSNAKPAEITEMLWAIAGGSQMGPGEGWFHPGQSRYGWQWLVDRFDADHDGIITREEFTGPAHVFDRLDANRDGVLTEADFDWSQNSPLSRQASMAAAWFYTIDRDSNGRISKEEWDSFYDRMAKGKGYVSREDLRDAFPSAPPAKPPQSKTPPPKAPPDEPSPLTFLLGLLSGELGSFHEGPAINDLAPEFTLRTQDGKQTVSLGQFRGKKPVVLVFGSFT